MIHLIVSGSIDKLIREQQEKIKFARTLTLTSQKRSNDGQNRLKNHSSGGWTYWWDTGCRIIQYHNSQVTDNGDTAADVGLLGIAGEWMTISIGVLLPGLAGEQCRDKPLITSQFNRLPLAADLQMWPILNLDLKLPDILGAPQCGRNLRLTAYRHMILICMNRARFSGSSSIWIGQNEKKAVSRS